VGFAGAAASHLNGAMLMTVLLRPSRTRVR
jgi:hypothetical protein